MEFSQVVKKLKKYFAIHELVDKQTFDAHGERAWKFFDIRLLITLLFIREKLDKGISINNWFWRGKFSQRGLRTNICSIVKRKTKADKLYLSAHVLGMGIDFDVSGMAASEVRKWLVSIAEELPYKIRLEYKFAKSGREITWVHLDVMDEEKNDTVYLFNV